MEWFNKKLGLSIDNEELKIEAEKRVAPIFNVVVKLAVVLWLIFIGFDYLFAPKYWKLFLPTRIMGATISFLLTVLVNRKKLNPFVAKTIFYNYLLITLIIYFIIIDRESLSYYFTGFGMVIVLLFALFILPPKLLISFVISGALALTIILIFNPLPASEILGLGGFALISELIMMFGVSIYNYVNFIGKIKSDLALKESNSILEIKTKEIFDSINYAKRLQDAVLPSSHEIAELFENHFIIYKPKDIVAGDFYWIEKKENYIYLAAADCTGHGVPGAMVSMVCSNALSRCIYDYNLTETNQILDETRNIVIDAFGRNNTEVKDGMDISLCRIDVDKRNLQWSGANNPLWLFKKNEFTELKPDRQPIGQYDFAKPFKAEFISIEEPSSIYLFSDGVCDQIGGPKKKKLKTTGFWNLINQIQNLDFKTQEIKIREAIANWQNNYEQVDDILIIGLKL